MNYSTGQAKQGGVYDLLCSYLCQTDICPFEGASNFSANITEEWAVRVNMKNDIICHGKQQTITMYYMDEAC